MGSRWQDLAGDDAGPDYAARMDAHMAARDDVHGEADLVTELAPPGGRVLDAGCGTGRVAIELARRGMEVVGTDVRLYFTLDSLNVSINSLTAFAPNSWWSVSV